MYEELISHEGLGKYRVIRARNPVDLVAKIRTQQNAWSEQWRRKQDAEWRNAERERAATDKQEKIVLAAQLTKEAEEAVAELTTILQVGLKSRIPDVWDSMMDRRPFSKPRPSPPEKPVYPQPSYPERPDPSRLPRKPRPDDPEYQPRIGLADNLIPGGKQRRIREAEQRYAAALAAWKASALRFNEQAEDYNKKIEYIKDKTNRERNKFRELYQRRITQYNNELKQWEAELAKFEYDRQKQHRSVAAMKAAYLALEPSAIEEYCGAILTNSKYPEWCPQDFDLEYTSDNRTLLLQYQLPNIDDIPSVKVVRYNQTQNKFIRTPLSESACNKVYEDCLYQIALRTLHELFAFDKANALDSIVFNGIVRAVDKATGQKISPCIMSVQVSKAEFEAIDLERVDPKACFKRLKGVSAARLHVIAPVAPIAQLNREDSRFVDSYDVAAGLDDSVNLAAMDWEDFEHLIRELFAKELSASGGEVKVTQASRDGGVDAIAFDPDPIRGGKIVIQAKRYTNVVGVAAVRDLYGTVHNEGANKGILVTTSHYGSDAYEFAKGKPITLLDGGGLLSLLAKHGHKAKIDLREAKAINNNRLQQK